MLAAPSIAITASGTFGRKPATRSPARTPSRRSARANAWTASRSSACESSPRRPRSFHATIAGRSSPCRSRFSAKFSRAPSNHRGPSSASGGAIRSPAVSTASHAEPSARTSLTTPQKRHTSAQNAAGSATDHSYSASTSVVAAAGARPASARWKRVSCARSTSEALGRQIGASVIGSDIGSARDRVLGRCRKVHRSTHPAVALRATRMRWR
jgi:hypothetical protein